MKNKGRFIIWAIILSLFLVNIVIACSTIDWRFTLNIGNLNVNADKLEKLCTEESCTISEDFITIKSHYNEKVAVIIGKTTSILGFKGITIRLPYELNEKGVPVISEIDPETYNWKESVKKDLDFLKTTGVLEIEDSEIEKISELATNGKNILYCKNEWKLLGPNCKCNENGEELCAKCSGASAFDTFLPQKLLTIETQETPVENAERSEEETREQTGKNKTYLYYLIPIIVLVVIIVVILFIKLKQRNL